jgi:hypothetical protein
MFGSLVAYVQNSGYHFAVFFLVLAVYGAVKIVLYVPELVLDRASPRALGSTLAAIGRIFLVGFVFFFVADQALQRINVAGINGQVARNNDALMRLDKALFRVYVPFWFENTTNPIGGLFRQGAAVLVRTYESLPFVMAVSMVVALVRKGELFSRVLAMYFVIIAISMVGWFLLPATSPLDAYVDGVPPPVPNESVGRYLASYRASPPVREFTGSLRNIRRQMGDRLWVTTIPSMHIAWSIVVLYTLVSLSRVLLLAAVPYFALNLISTMSTLQHYAVDVVLGMAVAVVAIGVVGLLPSLNVGFVNGLSDAMRRDAVDFARLLKPPRPKRS